MLRAARFASRGATFVTLVGVAALLLGCRSAASVVPHQRDIDAEITSMRASSRPFYFAGSMFDGLPLTMAQYEDWHAGGLFVYGTCTIPAGQDGGCSPPVQIQIFRFDARNWGRAVGCHRQPSLLAVPTVRHDGLVLVSKRAVIKIYARTRAEDRRVAVSLRSIKRPNELLRRLPAPSHAVRLLLASVCR
jgi:hypothetical protein